MGCLWFYFMPIQDRSHARSKQWMNAAFETKPLQAYSCFWPPLYGESWVCNAILFVRSRRFSFDSFLFSSANLEVEIMHCWLLMIVWKWNLCICDAERFGVVSKFFLMDQFVFGDRLSHCYVIWNSLKIFRELFRYPYRIFDELFCFGSFKMFF